MSAARSLANLKPWQPGQSGNPQGYTKIPEHLRGIKSLTQGEVNKIISKYARLKYTELTEAIEAKTATVLELAIAAVFEKSIKYGDFLKLGFLLERAIGKVPASEPIDHDDQDDLLKLSNEDLYRLIKLKMESPGDQKP